MKMCLNETYSRVRASKNLSYKFTIQNDLKQGDVLSLSLFNVALEYDIRRVEENKEGLNLNGTPQLFDRADDVMMSGRKHRYHAEKNTEALLNANKEVGLEFNPEKTRYTRMLMSRCQKAGERHGIKIANRCFEDVAKFKYLGTTLTDQIACTKRLNSGNACYHSVQSLLSSHLLSA
jgi:hypothetical protein